MLLLLVHYMQAGGTARSSPCWGSVPVEQSIILARLSQQRAFAMCRWPERETKGLISWHEAVCRWGGPASLMSLVWQRAFAMCRWSVRVLEEFFAQGDRERAAGLPVSPMMDRTSTSHALSQINFIEFIVAPLFSQARDTAGWSQLSFGPAALQACLYAAAAGGQIV